MEFLGPRQEPPHLSDWGNPYDTYQELLPGPLIGPRIPAPHHARILEVTGTPQCPHCGDFTYFHTPGSKNNAARWRSATIGFRKEEVYDLFYAGIVTIECPECRHIFGYKVKVDAIRAYMQDCPIWPKEEVIQRPIAVRSRPVATLQV